MSASTKDKIIDTSINLFSQKGYTETSIRDIAKEAVIKASTIYYYFKSKEAILSLILNEYMDMLRKNDHRRKWYEERPLVVSGELEVTAEKVMSYMVSYFKAANFDRYRKMLKIICSEAIRNDTVREHFRTQNNDSFNYLKSILDTLQEAGTIPKCDTVKIAGILRAIPFSFMFMDSIDIKYISTENTDTDMFSLVEYIISIVMEGHQ